MKRKFPYKDKDKEQEFQKFKAEYHEKTKRERLVKLEKAKHTQTILAYLNTYTYI